MQGEGLARSDRAPASGVAQKQVSAAPVSSWLGLGVKRLPPSPPPPLIAGFQPPGGSAEAGTTGRGWSGWSGSKAEAAAVKGWDPPRGFSSPRAGRGGPEDPPVPARRCRHREAKAGPGGKTPPLPRCLSPSVPRLLLRQQHQAAKTELNWAGGGGGRRWSHQPVELRVLHPTVASPPQLPRGVRNPQATVGQAPPSCHQCEGSRSQEEMSHDPLLLGYLGTTTKPSVQPVGVGISDGNKLGGGLRS